MKTLFQHFNASVPAGQTPVAENEFLSRPGRGPVMLGILCLLWAAVSAQAAPPEPQTYSRTYNVQAYEDHGKGPYFYRSMSYLYRPEVDTKLQRPLVYTRPVYAYQPVQSSTVRVVRNVAVEVQTALQARGYYEGAIDGNLGPLSREAIRDFQVDHRLPVTGRIDNRLIQTLNLP